MRILLLITSTVLRAKKKCFNFQMVMEWLINSYSSLFVSSFLICTDSSDEALNNAHVIANVRQPILHQ